MTLENARVLRKHRLELGKKVDDIDNLYPQLAKEDQEKPKDKEEVPQPPPIADTNSPTVSPKKKEQKDGKKSKR